MSIYYKDTLVAGSGGTPDALPLAGGTMTGAINMDGNKVTGLPAPTADLDAVTKAYLDNAIATAVANYLAKAGGSMTGAINMGGNKITSLGNPTAAGDAATKSYVDSAVPSGTFLPTTGGAMSGNINMGENKITNLAQPSNTGDAVNLFYALSNFLNVDGSNQMAANLNLNLHRVTNVSVPINNNDAATKKYVDDISLGIFIGSYTGSGQAQSVTFPTKIPQFVIIFEDGAIPTSNYATMPFAIATQQFTLGRIRLKNNTLTIQSDSTNNGGVNMNGREYGYIALL